MNTCTRKTHIVCTQAEISPLIPPLTLHCTFCSISGLSRKAMRGELQHNPSPYSSISYWPFSDMQDWRERRNNRRDWCPNHWNSSNAEAGKCIYITYPCWKAHVRQEIRACLLATVHAAWCVGSMNYLADVTWWFSLTKWKTEKLAVFTSSSAGKYEPWVTERPPMPGQVSFFSPMF